MSLTNQNSLNGSVDSSRPQKLLIIGTVWPEPSSSAAGVRMLQLIDFFKQQNYQITFGCAAAESEWSFPLQDLEVHKSEIKLNCGSFNDFIAELMPDIVLFDRFMIEEQFGWRVAEVCPQALRLLDTEDLHCLRYARQHALKRNEKFEEDMLLTEDISKRELASIWRCDASLIISEKEITLLQTIFKVDQSLLVYLPFMMDFIDQEDWKSLPAFEDRKNFISIGNFLHEPNWNAVLYLKQNIWPLIRKKLPEAEMAVYGAYPSQKVWQLHQPEEGFLIKGKADDAGEVMSKAKVCLAPLRFGAGLKGKLADAMKYGTPSVTTSIGAEGMNRDLPWPGFIADAPEDFACKAVQLYHDATLWQEQRKHALDIVNQRFNKRQSFERLQQALNHIQQNLQRHRQQNFTGQMLMHHFTQSTKYLSKWIETKNASK